jgi:TolB protein
MPETSSTADDRARDHLLVRHPEGKSDRFPLPEGEGEVVKVGRELDNHVVLTDPKASRHHAELRRMGGIIELKDLGSINGTLINDNKIQAETWIRLKPGQVIQIAETRLIWEQDLASQSTVPLKRPQADTIPSAVPPPVVQSSPAAKPQTSLAPWAVGIGLVLLLLIVAGLLVSQTNDEDTPGPAAQQPGATADQGDPASQSLGEVPAPTATPSGPQLAIPVIEVLSVDVLPIIFGASPSTTDAYIFVDVRARNVGNIPYVFSISNFSLRTREGQAFAEAGATISENYLRTLGAIDRFENLSLTPGGSVPGSLVYELPIAAYDFDLVFEGPELAPVVLGLGVINMERELKLAAGTPAAVLDAGVEEPTVEPPPTRQSTPTATRPPLIPAPQVVARSALQGTIAFPVYNGETYDLYFGDVANGDTIFYGSQASQPAFSPDGSRIAFHSWDPGSRGLVTQDISRANGIIVANFIEDQLPTWTADGEEIVLLTRRSGDRKSNLVKVGSRQERTEGKVIGEGEYPTIGANGRLIFKGWETTGFGLRAATDNLADLQSITDSNQDTAPAPAPNGEQVAFMSERSGNWDVYLINLDGSNLRRLTDDEARDGLPTWSPDGNAIAFVSDRGGVWAIWVMTPDGLGMSQLFTLPGSADGSVGTDTFASRGWAEERLSWTRADLVE